MKCTWCGEEFDYLRTTEYGHMCEQCIAALRSRGEEVLEGSGVFEDD